MGNYVLNAEPGHYALTGYDVKLLIHQAGALVKHTGTLARLCTTAQSDDQSALITATYLTAAAALEALLSEAAHDHERGLYANPTFRNAGAPQKFEMLMHESAPELLKQIWRVRVALTHSEPDNPRSGEKGIHMTIGGAGDTAQFVQELAIRIAERYALQK